MKKSVFIAMSCLFAPVLAMAHPGHELSPGMTSGVVHPLTDIGHLAAMLVAGCCATQFSRTQRWVVPIGFVLVMLLGVGMGYFQVSPGHVAVVIAASLITLLLLMMKSVRLTLSISVLLITCMGMALGYEYGTEFPHQSGGIGYMSGFALSTAVLYVAGFRIAKWVMKKKPMSSSSLPRSASHNS